MSNLSSDLLAQARRLARNEPKKPKQASLRRSVSTAYYALFHFLIEEATKMMIGAANRRKALRELAGRSFGHGEMREACREFAKPPSSQPKRLFQPFAPRYHANAEVKTIANHFINLQELRHTADYDRTYDFTRLEALNSATQAEEAMQAWRLLKRADEELAMLFVVALMGWPFKG